jgi:hypothetical protein
MRGCNFNKASIFSFLSGLFLSSNQNPIFGGANITHELNHVILGDIHDMQEFWPSRQNFFGDCLPDGAGSADDQKARALDEEGAFL